MIKPLLRFVPAKWRVREEVKAKGEGQLALGQDSLTFWQQRLGWSPQAARYLATAFAFGVRENIASVLEVAQQLSDSQDFEEKFVKRLQENPSVIGAALEASKFTSSNELRDLLGRILAGDLRKTDSVSRRAVSVAQDLSPQDLEEFLKLRSVAWRVGNLEYGELVLVLGKRLGLYDSEFLSISSDEIGVDYHTFGEFQHLGLVQERAYGLSLRLKGNENEILLTYGNRNISLRPTTKDSKLELGMYALTKAGSEILELFIDEKGIELEDYFNEVCAYWQSHGFELTQLGD